MSVTTWALSKATPLLTTAPLLVCRVWEGENQNKTRTAIASLGAFSARASSPSQQRGGGSSCQMWCCLRAQCEMKSGKDVGCRKHHSENCCSQEFPPPFVQVPLCPDSPMFSKLSLKKDLLICIRALLRRREDARSAFYLLPLQFHHSHTQDSAAKISEEQNHWNPEKVMGEKKEKTTKIFLKLFFQLWHVLNLFPQTLFSSLGSLLGNWLGL